MKLRIMDILSLDSNFFLGLNFLMSRLSVVFLQNFYATCVVSNVTVGWNPMPATLWINCGVAADKFGGILRTNIDLGCQAFVVADDVAIDFLDRFNDVHDDALQRFALKLVVVYPSTLGPYSFSSIFDHPAVEDIPNFVAINFKDQDTLSLIRSRYPGGGSEVFDEFSLSDLTLKNHNDLFFPTKDLSDLQGHHVKFAIFNYKPYTLWKAAETSESNAVVTSTNGPDEFVQIDGTESLVFLEFCRRFNCTLDLSLDEESEWGEIFENRTGNGIMGALTERRADVGVGALYSWHSSFKYLTLSKSISRTGVTCIVPKSKLASNFSVLILPFKLNLWIAVIASFGIGVLAMKGISKVTSLNTRNDVLTFIRIFLMQSINGRHKSAQAKLLYLSYFVLVIMIGNAYSSGLATVLTVPRYTKTIDTVQKLSDWGMPWVSTHDAWIFSIQQAEQPTIVKLLSTFHTYSRSKLEKLAHTGEVAYTIERLPYGHYAVGNYITEETVGEFQIMLDDIYWENCVAMAKKTWPLMPQLDDLILRIAQSGIQKYWEQEVIKKHDNIKIQNEIQFSRQPHNAGPVKLKLSHLISAFMIWISGILLSILVFSIEVIYNRRCN